MPTDDSTSEDEAILQYLSRTGPAQQEIAAEDAATLHLLQSSSEDHELVQALLPATHAATSDDWSAASFWALGWIQLGLEAREVKRWIRAGIAPTDAALAGDLIAEGIAPERLNEEFEHPRTGERVTILDVLDRWPAGFSSLGQALDDAGIERVRRPRPSRHLKRPHSA